MTWCYTLLLLYPPVHQLDGTSCCWNLFCVCWNLLSFRKQEDHSMTDNTSISNNIPLLQQENHSLCRQNDGTVSYYSQHCAPFPCPGVSATEVRRGKHNEGPREIQKLHKDPGGSAEACEMHGITWFYMLTTLMKTANIIAIFCLQINTAGRWTWWHVAVQQGDM